MTIPPVDAAFEDRVARLARQMAYPPTPDFAARLPVRRVPAPALRRWAVAALGVILTVGALMAVPPVRAAVLEIIRIGAVRILVGEPTPTLPPSLPLKGAAPTPTESPRIIPTDQLAVFSRLYGETTLDNARRDFGYPIKLPAYPSDLGEPDHVYQQDVVGGPMIVLVWVDPDDAGRVRLSLHLLSDDAIVYKGEPKVIEETTVNGEQAFWLEGPYPILVTGPGGRDLIFARLMDGHALVWFDPSTRLTYRLETDLSLEEAIRIAESIR